MPSFVRSCTMMCAVVPKILECRYSLKPVMIPTVPIKAATPKVMPVTETTVFREIVRLRRLARRYRRPTTVSYGSAKPLFLRTQLGEKDDIADGCLVRKEHDQPVDADAFSSCRRHPVFEGTEEVFIDNVGLFVSGLALCRLAFEPRALIERVIQL